MRRYLALLLAGLMIAGCTTRPAQAPAPEPTPAPALAPAPAAPAAPAGPLEQADLTTISTDELAAGLETYLNEGADPPPASLKRLFEQWFRGPKPPVFEADLDGDGNAEYVTAIRLAGSQRPLTGAGALYIIFKKAGRWAVERSPGEEVIGVYLHRLIDVTGDGRPEIVWGATNAGAHTVHYTIFVSQWSPERLTLLPGATMEMSYMELSFDGRDLVMKGGLIGSAGAGHQRTRTDRYRWVDGQMQLADRTYEASDLGYYRLVDGLLHERFGRTAEAEKAYREAMDPARPVVREGMAEPEQAGSLPEAVRATARMRLAWLLMKSGRPAETDAVLAGAGGPYADLVRTMSLSSSIPGACGFAASWAKDHPEFLKAMNGVFGYANDIWTAESLCGNGP